MSANDFLLLVFVCVGITVLNVADTKVVSGRRSSSQVKPANHDGSGVAPASVRPTFAIAMTPEGKQQHNESQDSDQTPHTQGDKKHKLPTLPLTHMLLADDSGIGEDPEMAAASGASKGLVSHHSASQLHKFSEHSARGFDEFTQVWL